VLEIRKYYIESMRRGISYIQEEEEEEEEETLNGLVSSCVGTAS